jgi:hypothetical protein
MPTPCRNGADNLLTQQIQEAVRRWLDEYTATGPPANPADYGIAHLEELARQDPNLRVVLYIRASTLDQDLSGSLRRQLEWALEQLGKLGVTIIPASADSVAWVDVSAGWMGKGASKLTRMVLLDAAAAAREHGAVLVAVSVDRLVRKMGYKPEHIADGWPRTSDLDDWRRVVGDVPCATIEHPNMTLEEVRGIESKRGMDATEKPIGRPPNPETFKARWLPVAQELRAASKSYPQIADEITRRAGRRVPAMKVWRWLN